MPRLPIDYSRTIIYKLVHKDDLDDVNVYVGHTTDFTKRKNRHKDSCNLPSNKEYNTKKYQFIRENGGWGEWVMLKIEDYPCKDVYEAIQRERYWMKELKAKLNTCEPGRTKKEYREDNIDKIREYDKMKYENNKEKITEYQKEWYEKNKDKIVEKGKQNYENNKQKILERLKEKIKCEKCGCEIMRGSLLRHKKSLKCQNHGSQ
jgi:hypothetical protein